MSSLFTVALAASMLQGSMTTVEPRLLRQPDVHGDTVVFVYAGDLWASNVQSGSVARRIATNVGVRGNVSLAPLARPHISPDGKWVAFTGNYDGSSNIYIVPIEGGEPRRLTYSNASEQVFDWTPDGRVAYITSEGLPFLGRQTQLKYVDVNGGLPVNSQLNEISAGEFTPDGKKVVYTRVNSYGFNWRRYRGGTQGRISIYDLEKNEYSELPAKREQNYFPMVVGKSIFYVSDRQTGTLNLFSNTGGKDTQVTKFEDGDVRWPASDGKTIVWERNGFLFHYNPSTKAETKLDIRIPSENLAARPALKNLVANLNSVSISPSGARITVDARGEVFSVPAKSGETRNMTKTSGTREMNASWSPDGKWIAYISDKTGERELYIQPQAGGPETALTKNSNFRIESFDWFPNSKKIVLQTSDTKLHLLDFESKAITTVEEFADGGGSYTVSEDGKWMAYTKARGNGFSQILVREIETGKTTALTEGYYSDDQVAFDQSGKYLYFTSNRVFSPQFGLFEFSLRIDEAQRLYAMQLQADTPNPFLEKNDEEPDPDAKPASKPEGSKEMRIDFDGIENRIMVLPMGVGSYGNLVGGNGSLFFTTNRTLMQYRMGSKQPTPIYEGYFGGTFNPSRTKLAAFIPGGIQVLDVAPGLSPNSPRVDLGAVEAVIDPRAEWKQIVQDAWRYQRDHFYDSEMAGVDWNAVGKKYVDMVQFANHRSDVNYILGMMIGELGTGHAYVQAPGDVGGLPRMAVGHLCADFEVKNGGVVFKKILRGFNDRESVTTPLGTPGIEVKEGEYLVAIDGSPVTANDNPAKFLINKVGKWVTLAINSKPGLDGARKVRVKPIGSDIQARYEEYIENNRKLVSKLSGGRIGYMHIQNTAAEGSSDFVRGFYSQWDKEALIVDERWNGGGYIQPWFVDTLSRKLKSMIAPRHGNSQPDSPTFEGPAAMLINGYAGSGGDYFPYLFRQAKRGQLIGKRTWGGLVGITGGYTLVDGGSLTTPSFGIYDPKTNEIIAENTGIDPDIDVDNRPDLVAKGEDPQLEAAIKHLMKQIGDKPAPKVAKPKIKVGRNGKINP